MEKESKTIATASRRRAPSRFSRSRLSRGSFSRASKSSRTCYGRNNTSVKDQATFEEMKVAELPAEQKFMKRGKAAESETESLRIQQ